MNELNTNTADADLWGVTIEPFPPIIDITVTKVLAGNLEELQERLREVRSNLFESGHYIMEEHYSPNCKPSMHLPGCDCPDKDDKSTEPVWVHVKFCTRSERAKFLAWECKEYYDALSKHFGPAEALDLTHTVLDRMWGNS